MTSTTNIDELDEELAELLVAANAAELHPEELLAWARARAAAILAEAGEELGLPVEPTLAEGANSFEPGSPNQSGSQGIDEPSVSLLSSLDSEVSTSAEATFEADDEILELDDLEDLVELIEEDDERGGLEAASHDLVTQEGAAAAGRTAALESGGVPREVSDVEETRAYAVHSVPVELVPTVGQEVLRQVVTLSPQTAGAGPFRSPPPETATRSGAPEAPGPEDATGPLAILVLREDAPRLSRIPQGIAGDTIGLGRRSSADFDGGSYLWRCRKWEEFSALYERELVNGALFARSNDTPELHAQIEIFLELPDQVPRLRMTGGVIQVNPIEEAQRDGSRAGFAVQLLGLTPHRRALLSDIAKTAEAVANLGREVGTARDDLAEIATASASEVTGTINLNDLQIEDDLRREVRRLTGLSPMDRLELEGPERDVNPSHAANAFTRIASRWHPDVSDRFTGQEPRRLAMQVFLLLEEAYQHLTASRSSASASRGDDQPPASYRPPSGPKESVSRSQAPTDASSRAPPPGGLRGPPPPPGKRGTTRSSFQQDEVETQTDWSRDPGAARVKESRADRAAPNPERRDSPPAPLPSSRQQDEPGRKPSSSSVRALAVERHSARLAASLRPARPAAVGSVQDTVNRLSEQRAASRERAAAKDAATQAEPGELGRAIELMSLRRYDDAIALLRRVPAPQNTERKYRVLLLLAQGRSAAAKREVAAALDCYQELLALDPDHPVAKRDWVMLQALKNTPAR